MKKNMVPISLMVWPYLFFVLLALPESLGETVLEAMLYGYVLLTIPVYLVNVIWAVRQKDAHQLAFWNILIKLVHIPFYLVVFAAGALFMLAMVVPALVLVSPMIAMMLAVIDYLLMLTSSAYGISAVVKSRKQHKLSMIHVVMHLIFVMDLISAVIVWRKTKMEDSSIKKEEIS